MVQQVRTARVQRPRQDAADVGLRTLALAVSEHFTMKQTARTTGLRWSIGAQRGRLRLLLTSDCHVMKDAISAEVQRRPARGRKTGRRCKCRGKARSCTDRTTEYRTELSVGALIWALASGLIYPASSAWLTSHLRPRHGLRHFCAAAAAAARLQCRGQRHRRQRRNASRHAIEERPAVQSIPEPAEFVQGPFAPSMGRKVNTEFRCLLRLRSALRSSLRLNQQCQVQTLRRHAVEVTALICRRSANGRGQLQHAISSPNPRGCTAEARWCCPRRRTQQPQAHKRCTAVHTPQLLTTAAAAAGIAGRHPTGLPPRPPAASTLTPLPPPPARANMTVLA